MDIKISLKTNDVVAAGINQDAVIKDIEAEVNKLAEELNVTPKRNEKKAPAGAQGGPEWIKWILKAAIDPKMAIFYAKAIIFAINKILNALKQNGSETEVSSHDTKNIRQTQPITIKMLGKEITLPAATIIIQNFLKSIGDE